MNPDPEKTSPPEENFLSDEEKLLALLSYVPFLCLVPYLNRDRSAFVTGHVHLGMTLFLIEIGALILRFRFIWDLILLFCVIAAVVGIFHVVQGRGLYIPFLSDLFSRKY